MIKLCERLNFPCYINNEQLEITATRLNLKSVAESTVFRS